MEPVGDHTENPSYSSIEDPVLPIPTLPEELITAILVRLPVKSLLQFKCVSKEWFALISSTHFVKTHLSISAKDCTRHRLMLEIGKHHGLLRHCSVSSLFYDSVTDAFDLDYPIKDPQRIVGSVNGLICYRIASNGFVLWNPSTRKFNQVPDPMPTKTADYSFSYGFGYDEVLDDYKVVAIFIEISKCYCDAKIYSLNSDSWRTLDDFQRKMVRGSSGKLVNGKLHWLTKGWGIMSIDLVDEKCRKVEQPCYRKEIYFLTLGVLGNDLSVLSSCRKRIDVWVMKEYGVKESWTKLYTIKCPNYMLSPPLCMSIEGEVLHMFGSALTIYNPEDDLMRYPEVTIVDGYLKAELYIESLVCPVLQKEPMTQHCG